MRNLLGLLLLIPSLSLAQSFDYSCYQASVSSSKSDVTKVYLGWSEKLDWSSFISYQVSKTKNFSSDLGCPPKPIKGFCVIHDDGAELEITAYSKKRDMLKMKFPGLPVLIELDGAGEFKPSVLKDSEPVILVMKRTNKSFCKY